jgi:hypothetical protein
VAALASCSTQAREHDPDPIATTVEAPEEVRDRILLAARYIPIDQLGTCDDADFAPYADDTTTARDLAFAKIQARVRGTALVPGPRLVGPHGVVDIGCTRSNIQR